MEEQKLYDKYLQGKHWEKHPTIYAESFVKFLKEKKFDDLILDIGCGNGRDVNVFEENNFKSLGVDYKKEEIDLCRKNFPKLRFEIQNAENLKIKNNSVGAVFMINVIHYLNEKKSLDEVYRILKNGGYFFIHFNIQIEDKNGKIDYKHDEKDIFELISRFKIIKKRKFERVDIQPKEHTHEIVELILQK
jgi:SAM-dependent methyltransferase